MTAAADPAWLRYLAQRAARDLDEVPADEVVRWAAAAFGDDLAVASSMADAVVIDLVTRTAPGVDVLFLETGYHFAETIGTRAAVETTYPVRVRELHPEQTVADQDAAYGPRLHDRDPDLCCALRKVAPLSRALRDYSGWITGLRRADSPGRARVPVVEFDERHQLVKVNPIAAWDDEHVSSYAADRGVIVNPLVQDGYGSVGCAPCTRRPHPGEGSRAGRWAGLAKTECGIHV